MAADAQATTGSPQGFRDLFAAPVIRETLRAFLLFSVLLLTLLAILGELAFRDLSLNVLRERLDLGRNAALEIAREISEVGGGGSAFDYAQARADRDRLNRLIEDRIERTNFIRHVEVRDRYGVRVAFAMREGIRQLHAARARLPAGLPVLDEKLIQVPLQRQGSRPEGEVRLGISQDALEQELLALRRALWIKIGIAGLLALGVLVLGLFYVLHLIRKNRLLEQARQSSARASYVGLLASGLAHEIRNPLNAMNMNLQMLEEELLAHPELADPEHVELFESTKSEIKRLERLVNNFLTYARPAQPRFESRDLNGVVREVARLLEADFRQHGVELQTDLEPLLPQVDTDETQFKQALINLLVNARQVLEGGGRVRIRTRAGSRGDVVVEVQDDGPGIPVDVRERIFEVFYSSRGGGTGLGLPIAKQIVERHGGAIEVETEEGHGTTFRIRLPRRHPRATMTAVAAEGAGAQPVQRPDAEGSAPR
jgi:signal transduction histidine kinase